jgi:RNA polymerase sigma-70 factor, ECF subfamily
MAHYAERKFTRASKTQPITSEGRLGDRTAKQSKTIHPPHHEATRINQVFSLKLSGLLADVALGNQVALSEFYDETHSIVCSLARRIVCQEKYSAGRCETSEEVTLNVFLQVWKESRSFNKARETPLSWLTVMTRNQALVRLRATSHQSHGQTQQQDDLALQSPHDVQGNLPEAASLLAGRRTLITAALAQLTTEQRLLINAAYFDGLNLIAITELFQLPLDAVKANIRDGMIALRNHVNNLHG